MKKIITESPGSDESQKRNEIISGDSSLSQSSISPPLSNLSGDIDSECSVVHATCSLTETYEQNGAYSTSSSAHSPSRPAATIDNKEEETSYAEVFSVKTNDSSVFEIMNHIASSFATNFLKQLEMHKLESQMISIKNKCDQLNKESSLTWRESISYIVKKYPFHKMNDEESMKFLNLCLTKCLAALNGIPTSILNETIQLAEKKTILWISTFTDAISKRKKLIEKLKQLEEQSSNVSDTLLEEFSNCETFNQLIDEV